MNSVSLAAFSVSIGPPLLSVAEVRTRHFVVPDFGKDQQSLRAFRMRRARSPIGGCASDAAMKREGPRNGGPPVSLPCVVRLYAACGASTFCSSPDAYISRTMSQPPMNSPFT